MVWSTSKWNRNIPPTLPARPNTYLLVRFFEVFHEHRDDDVDEDELRHEDEDDEEERREVGRDAAVLQAVVRRLALLTQRVLRGSERGLKIG